MDILKKTMLRVVIALSLGMMGLGCKPSGEETPSSPDPQPASASAELPGQARLAWGGQVFDFMLEDLNGDGLKDLISIDHTVKQGRLIYQKEKQAWGEVRSFEGVGFHPGSLVKWPNEPNPIVLGAEGDNSIRALMPDEVSGVKVLSNLKEVAPRYIERFRWPGWGESLVVSPYANGYVVLLKNYDPVKGEAQERIVVPLSSKAHSIRAAERVTVADIDEDGVDELLMVISITNEVLKIKYPGKKAKQSPKVELLYENAAWGAANEAHAVDLDRDGDNDLLIPDEIGPPPRGGINVLINQGKGRFKEGTALPFFKPNGVQELSVARDHDGLDYVFAVGFGGLALYQVPEMWRDGHPMPMRGLDWSADDYSRAIELTDVDGDGWLDAVLGRVYSESPLWMAYGPLWERFEMLAGAGFNLK